MPLQLRALPTVAAIAFFRLGGILCLSSYGSRNVMFLSLCPRRHGAAATAGMLVAYCCRLPAGLHHCADSHCPAPLSCTVESSGLDLSLCLQSVALVAMLMCQGVRRCRASGERIRRIARHN